MNAPLHSKRFTSIDQDRFATLSGDYNPLHMDPIAARRTQIGLPVVHGVHTLVWALEHLAERIQSLGPVRGLRAKFAKPVYVGDTVEFSVIGVTSSDVRAQITVDGAPVINITMKLGRHIEVGAAPLGPAPPIPDSPVDLAIGDAAGKSGRLKLRASTADVAAAFPSCSAWMGASRIGGLIGYSSLVGMVCPGLHSLFAGLDVSFVEHAEEEDAFSYEVLSVDDRFRALRHSVSGCGLYGTVDALFRMPSVAQSPSASYSEIVGPREFEGVTALVIGGSRGLGEVTARLIASGGGCAIITYASGKQDAERVAGDIRANGGTCETRHYDIHGSPEEQLAGIDCRITDIYYFATPPIFRRKGRTFTAPLHNEFFDFYVRAFNDLCEWAKVNCTGGCRILYPSSVAVADRPVGMTEYAMAKAAGEILCADITRFWPKVHVQVARLPRLLTDQTATVISVDSEQPADVILPILRELHRDCRQVAAAGA